MSKIIAIGNNKGGTSKTTTSISLAGALASKGYKVLLIDADPQANATEACGYENPDELDVTLASVMEMLIDDEELEPGIGILHHEEGFDLMPSSIELSGIEVSLVNVMNRERILKDYITMVSPFYDFVLLDCMPSLGMITINAFACADSVLIPVQAAYLPVKGLEQLIRTISKVRKQINPNLEIEGILMTMVDGRTNYAKEIMELVKDAYGNHVKIFEQSIPLSVRAAETSAEGVSIFKHDPNGKVAMAYNSLAEEVLS